MSLKAVHLFVITLATLALLGISGWCFQQRALGQNFTGDLAIALLCGVGGLGLLVYAFFFLRKTRHVSFL